MNWGEQPLKKEESFPLFISYPHTCWAELNTNSCFRQLCSFADTQAFRIPSFCAKSSASNGQHSNQALTTLEPTRHFCLPWCLHQFFLIFLESLSLFTYLFSVLLPWHVHAHTSACLCVSVCRVHINCAFESLMCQRCECKRTCKCFGLLIILTRQGGCPWLLL